MGRPYCASSEARGPGRRRGRAAGGEMEELREMEVDEVEELP
jgi:hypothetical protein